MMNIQLNRKQLELGDWVSTEKLYGWTETAHTNYCRPLKPDDQFSCVLLTVFWKYGIHIDSLGHCDLGKHDWAIEFLGPDLYILNDWYKKFYPDPPRFSRLQLIEAQNHVDQFLTR